MAEEDNAIARWSRRKAAARHGALADEPAPAPAATAPLPSGNAAARAGAPSDPQREALLEELSKIDIDTLSYEDDFSIFMRPKVPEHLRRAALRRLWTSHPMFTTPDPAFDGHVDYATAPTGEVRSSWLPGGLGYSSGSAEAGSSPEPSEGSQTASEALSADSASQPAQAPPDAAASSAPLPAPGDAADTGGLAEDAHAEEAPKGA
jgi:hypothetical protein